MPDAQVQALGRVLVEVVNGQFYGGDPKDIRPRKASRVDAALDWIGDRDLVRVPVFGLTAGFIGWAIVMLGSGVL